jgi:hypothetical protein
VAAHLRAAVAGELDEVEVVQDRQGTGEVGEEDEARLQGADQDRLVPVVVARDLRAQLADAGSDLGSREVDLADPVVRGAAPMTRG